MSVLTSTEILAAASQALEGGGYSRVEPEHEFAGIPATGRVFKDEYGIVAVAVYETCADLLASWPRAQAAVVELISKFVAAGDSKAWDGYLVLLTSGEKSAVEDELDSIRNDTTRLRKLVATGSDLAELSNVERALLPLLPIREQASERNQAQTALDTLPELLSRQGISETAVRIVVDAFLGQETILDRLHSRNEN